MESAVIQKVGSWIKSHKPIATIIGAIGLVSSILGIWQFLPDSYPTVTLDIEEVSEADHALIEKRELEFLESLYRHWNNDERFLVDLRLGDFRQTLPDNVVSEMYLRVFDISKPHLSRTLNFVSVLVQRGCHDQAIGYEMSDKCDQVAIFFEKPATTLDYEPNVGPDHPVAEIVEWQGPQWLTFVFDAKGLEIESSEFNLRIYGYGKLVHGSGGMGEHHYNFISQPYEPDKLVRSLR